jgi:hypothetical protein
MIRSGSNPYGPATPEQVAAFEARIGHPLPGDYRAFLLTLNGGQPERPVFAIPPDNSDLVRYFPGLHDGPYYHNLEYPQRTYRDQNRMPPELVPIASDPFGNWVCLGVAGEHLGRVYFWNHEREADEDEPPTWDNLRLLAGSFTEFVAGLQPYEPEAEPGSV